VEIGLAALTLPGVPTRHGLKPTVNVTIAASTLTGQDEQPGLVNGEPVPAPVARRLAGQPGARHHHRVVDQRGRALDTCPGLSAASYHPPPRLARHVLFRDPHCIWPGCRRDAHSCELDHRTPWPAGATSTGNLQPLCKKHHDLKHHSTWQVTRTDDGAYQWVSPTRHTYHYRPPEHPVPEPPPITQDEPPPF
jgi:hypothetical protein